MQIGIGKQTEIQHGHMVCVGFFYMPTRLKIAINIIVIHIAIGDVLTSTLMFDKIILENFSSKCNLLPFCSVI